MIKEILGEKLKKVRNDTGRSQQQMADAAKISLRYYQSLESGKKEPGFGVLYKIVRGLEMNPWFVFDLTEPQIKAPEIKISQEVDALIKATIEKTIKAIEGKSLDVAKGVFSDSQSRLRSSKTNRK